jgi:hypothetical protein
MAKGKSSSSGYILFSKEVRPKLQEQDPSLSFGQLAKAIGQRWKALSEAEREVYNAKAPSKKISKKKGRK